MKKAKRILAGALAALILTMSLPLSALADEADVPVESPSFEVSFDVDTGQEEISEDPPADIEATPEPTPEPTAEPTQEPTPTPESTATPTPTAEPTAVPTATPGVTATPTAVPTSTPESSAVPSASPVVTPTPTPTPSPQPVVNPVKLEHDVLDNVDKVCIYLFPVPNSSEITQEYSAEHKAIDIAASSGSPVYAAEDGTVSYVQIWDGSYDTTGMMSYGHMVEIRHADGNTTLYAHLSEINVQQGEKVVRGQRIGRVGSTGNSTGPHLHFEVITSEGKADPAEYLWTMPGEWIMGYAADTEAGISPTAVGNTGKSVVHYYSLAKETTTTVTGSLGHLPTKTIKSGSTEYPAYCLEKDKLIWGGIDFTWSSFTVPQQTTMKAILAEGFHETNSLDKAKWGDAQGSGYKGNYANETAKWLVTQYLIWAAEKNYITKHSNTSWTWKSQVDTDLETIAKNAYNPTVVRSYYAEVKAKLLNAYTIPSFASSSSSSFSTTIKLYWDGSKYTATVTDSNSVAAYYTYTYNGITFTKNGNKLTISTTNEYPSGVVATGSRTIGDDSNLAWWKCTDSSIQLIATPLGKTKTVRSYLKVQTVTPSYYIYLKKSSADTSMTNGDNRYSLEGAVYTVYSGNTAVATIATDASGYGYTNVALQNGRYSIKETTSPKNYYKDETTHWVTISYGDAALNVSDAPIPLEYSINLTKTSANVSITNGDSGYSLAGAVYKIYNSSGTEVASITTNSSGKGSSNVKLKNGTYTAVESKAPPGYALDTTRHTVRINNADATLNVSDVPLIKTVTLTKTSANTSITAGNSNYSLAGAVYDVYEGNSATGTPVASFTTNSSGVATLSRKLYPNRTYTILERTPPPGYVKDTTPHPFYLTYNSATMDVVDDPTTIRLTVKKKDSETNTSVAQGNASLAGAQYKVTYVNGTKTVENIVTTNSSGSATLRGLPIGVTVTVQEITAPAGYKLDSRVHTYVTTTKTEKIEYDLEPEDFTEDVFKGHIQITKQIEMLGADAQLEQGAEYQVYLKSAGSYANAKDTERDYLVTGADGKATTKDLPYGTYTLHQIKGVPGREFKDLDVDVHENGKTYEVTLTNELKYAQLKIVKTSEDGNVAGFTFKVTRLADGYSKTYTTNAAGEIITDQMPVYVDKDANQKFEYRIEEINVPDKYRTPDAQTITLTYGQTAEVRFYNQIARGTLEILKVDHDGVTPLEGAKFEITDDNNNVIATETSGPDGKIKVDSILYGQYHWSEVMAPKGYELDDTVHDFAIEYDEQVVEVTQENTPSVGSITAKKIDADGNAMPGVEFTLEYSTDDGATWAPVEARAEDSNPSIGGCTSAVVDGALETDENGVATFNGLQVDNQTVTITYRLTETGTKSGNTLLAAPMFIGSLPQVLDDGTEIVDVTVTAVNNQNYTLPSSGGNGMVSVPVGIALALISVSCFAAWLWKKKLF
ncbi:SpaA isopeptide-forming pilin-related protein [Hominenteromicrobium sp.]|uniref:SpaA isopeptide-forming pilin-related protein n=1 Tax=Hominenteromicrobium sp. TaxID=3073581 RepID=UPI003AEF25A1